MSDILGCTIMVVTRDKLIPILRRSMNTAEFRGWWDVPGGHPEPSRAGVESSKAGPKASQLALGEFFYCCKDEAVGELNVPLESLDEPVLLGVLRAHASRGRPHALFRVNTSLTGQEVLERYLAGGLETDESTCISMFSCSDLIHGQGSSVIGSRSVDFCKDVEPFLVPCTKMIIDLMREKGSKVAS